VELVETLPFAKILMEPIVEVKIGEFSKNPDFEIPEWHKEEVRRSVRDIAYNPSILVDEDNVFKMLIR
jgi:hypothetical protein